MMAKQASAFAFTLKAALEEYKARLGAISQQSIAEQLGVAKSAVSGWLTGQVPRAKHIEGLALILGRGDDSLTDTYRTRLFEAAGEKPPVASGGPLRRAQEGKTIKIGVVKYGAFTDFFEQLLHTFAQYSGYPARIERVELPKLTDGLRDGTFDIGAAFFATPDRASKLRFINTPLKVGVNALTFSKALPTVARMGSFAPPNFRPIVVTREAGWLYSTYVHEYRSMQHEILEHYDAKEYARRLLTSFERWLEKPEEERDREVPAVLADEVMCLEVVNELMNMLYQREHGRTFAKFGLPVLLLGRNGNLQGKLQETEFHPSYHVSICTNRSEPIEWHQYVEETFDIFLSSNSSYVGSLYANLHRNFSNQIETMDRELESSADSLKKELDPKIEPKEALSDPWMRLVLAWTHMDGPDNDDYPVRHPWTTIVAAAKRYTDPKALEEQTMALEAQKAANDMANPADNEVEAVARRIAEMLVQSGVTVTTRSSKT
jgi:transcriptional regulator with XRE-family HTH domain